MKLDDSFPSTIFIAGVPKVSKEKYDKLFNVLSKLIDKCFGKMFGTVSSIHFGACLFVKRNVMVYVIGLMISK